MQKKTEELETIIRLHELAIPSLDPDSFVALEKIIEELFHARHIEALFCQGCGKIYHVNAMYSVDACSEECHTKINAKAANKSL